ncbi:MAG: AMP-binding protein [Proteobacteria bacterium]|nr:AMP-binding protein [Pseudomonadota bacterium]
MSAKLELALQPDPSRLSLAAFIRDVVERHGPRVALRFEGRDWTYAELGAAVDRLARGMVGAGVVKGARVGLLMANRPEWVVATFAAARIGAVTVPVNTYAVAEERDYILRHGDVSLLILQRGLLRHDFLGDLLEQHPEIAGGEPGRLRIPALPSLRRVFCLGAEARSGAVQTWEELEALGDDVPDELLDALSEEVRPSDEGILIYTSGTTSKPKGVLHLQRAPVIQSYRFAEYMDLTPDDRTVTAQPFFWTAGICHSLGSHLAAGATLLLSETFDPGRALELAESERATMIIAWPHQGKAMAEHPGAGDRDLSSVSKLEYGTPLADLAGIDRNDWGIYGSFGMSETFTLMSAHPARSSPELRRTKGLPLPGMQIRIVDPSSGAPLGTGEQGEIAVKGVTFMRGYHKVEPENFLDAEAYFHTSDGGYIDAAGNLHWTGRLSGMIKTGGANVSPLEVETALDGCPGVSHGFAVGIPHPSLGEIVALAAVALPGESVDESGVRAYLRGKLAAYKVPRRVLEFRREELEYTGTQKVQLGPLRRLVLGRLAAEGAEVAGHVYASD